MTQDVGLRFDVFNQASGGVACQTIDFVTTTTAGSFALAVGPIEEDCLLDTDVFFEVSIDGNLEGAFTALEGRTQVHPAIGAATSSDGDFYSSGIRIFDNARLFGSNEVGNLHIDADDTKDDGDLYLNYYSGNAVHVGDGNAGIVMSVGSTGVTATNFNASEISTTNLNVSEIRSGNNTAGNIHLDGDTAFGDGRVYLNYYEGRGVRFGDGAGGVVASIDTAGNISTNGGIASPMFNVTQLFNMAGVGPDGFAQGVFSSNGGTLVFQTSASAYSAAANALIEYDLQIDGASRGVVMRQVASSANDHQMMSGTLVVTGVAAGNHTASIQLRSGLSNGSDYATIVVTEYPY